MFDYTYLFMPTLIFTTLSQDKLNRPVENLLMNQDIHFREIQEQKEFLSQAMPHIQSGYV